MLEVLPSSNAQVEQLYPKLRQPDKPRFPAFVIQIHESLDDMALISEFHIHGLAHPQRTI